MRILTCVCFALALAAQERATVTTPKPVDATIRTFEITGFDVQIPSSIFKPMPVNPFATAPPVNLMQWNIAIRYVDNVGNQYIDIHSDTTGAPDVYAHVFEGAGTLRTRLLQHLIDEKKIPPARIAK